MCAKNESRIMLNISYSRKLARDIVISRNLPSHLSYVSALPDITQKLKRDIDELKH